MTTTTLWLSKKEQDDNDEAVGSDIGKPWHDEGHPSYSLRCRTESKQVPDGVFLFRFSRPALVLFAHLKITASDQRGGRQPCMSPVEAWPYASCPSFACLEQTIVFFGLFFHVFRFASSYWLSRTWSLSSGGHVAELLVTGTLQASRICKLINLVMYMAPLCNCTIRTSHLQTESGGTGGVGR